MITPVPDPELVDHVAATSGLEPAEAARVIGDVLAWYREPVADYVRRRHTQLQVHGTRNDAAFETITAELEHRLVAPPPLSVRQVRRLVYG